MATTLSLVFTSAEARKIRTKHSIPKAYTAASSAEISEQSDTTMTVSIASDSITFCDSIRPLIRFYGFDKTVTGNKESFFISNGLEREVIGIEIVITYTDMKGRQLHKRKVRLDSNLPSGETRRYDISSWDIQKSFYYHRSVKPRRQATPFDIKIELISVTL